MSHDSLVVGIGSDHGDDRIGWLVADALQARAPVRSLVRHARVPMDLLDWLDNIRCLAICDGCHGMGPAGSWHHWTWPPVNLQVDRSAGSHALGLIDTLLLASRLDLLPAKVFVWSVEIDNHQPNAELSTKVAATVLPVANDIAAVLQRRQRATIQVVPY